MFYKFYIMARLPRKTCSTFSGFGMLKWACVKRSNMVNLCELFLIILSSCAATSQTMGFHFVVKLLRTQVLSMSGFKMHFSSEKKKLVTSAYTPLCGVPIISSAIIIKKCSPKKERKKEKSVAFSHSRTVTANAKTDFMWLALRTMKKYCQNVLRRVSLFPSGLRSSFLCNNQKWKQSHVWIWSFTTAKCLTQRQGRFRKRHSRVLVLAISHNSVSTKTGHWQNRQIAWMHLLKQAKNAWQGIILSGKEVGLIPIRVITVVFRLLQRNTMIPKIHIQDEREATHFKICNGTEAGKFSCSTWIGFRRMARPSWVWRIRWICGSWHRLIIESRTELLWARKVFGGIFEKCSRGETTIGKGSVILRSGSGLSESCCSSTCSWSVVAAEVVFLL